MKETGLPLCTSERDVCLSHCVVHLSPVFYLLLPFYALFPSPLTLTVKEDAAVYIAVFSVYLLCSQKKKHRGIILLVLSVLYFGFALSLLQASSTYYAEVYAGTSPNPAIGGPMVNRFDNLIFDPNAGLMGVLKTVLVNPGYILSQLLTTTDGGWEKLLYLFQMFLPIGFLPLFTAKPSRWLLSLPILINLLTNYPYQYDIGFQYHFGILAFFIYASILNLQEIKPPSRHNILTLATAACCCLYLLYILPTYSNYHNEWQKNKETYLQMEQILETVPQDASVCCSTFWVAHLAERNEIYELAYHDGMGDVDYIILDARYGINEAEITPYLEQGYVITQEYPNMLLFLTKEDSNKPPE